MPGQLLDILFQVSCQRTDEAKDGNYTGEIYAVDHIHNRLRFS